MKQSTRWVDWVVLSAMLCIGVIAWMQYVESEVDMTISVLTDGNGCFIASVGEVKGTECLDSVEEAIVYGEIWKALYLEELDFRAKEWKKVNGTSK